MSAARLLALALALAAGCKRYTLYVDDAAADACSAATTCTACAPRIHCGWCQAAQRCVTGTMTGPSDRACGGSDWVWVVGSCPSPPRDAAVTGDASGDR